MSEQNGPGVPAVTTPEQYLALLGRYLPFPSGAVFKVGPVQARNAVLEGKFALDYTLIALKHHTGEELTAEEKQTHESPEKIAEFESYVKRTVLKHILEPKIFDDEVADAGEPPDGHLRFSLLSEHDRYFAVYDYLGQSGMKELVAAAANPFREFSQGPSVPKLGETGPKRRSNRKRAPKAP